MTKLLIITWYFLDQGILLKKIQFLHTQNTIFQKFFYITEKYLFLNICSSQVFTFLFAKNFSSSVGIFYIKRIY